NYLRHSFTTKTYYGTEYCVQGGLIYERYQMRRLPPLLSSNFGLEILMGKDETIDFEDFLN
ncbi:17095_t:CDS:2, partial [Racocetra persica]